MNEIVNWPQAFVLGALCFSAEAVMIVFIIRMS